MVEIDYKSGFEASLNEAGVEEWELVSSHQAQTLRSRDFKLIFKREKEVPSEKELKPKGKKRIKKKLHENNTNNFSFDVIYTN